MNFSSGLAASRLLSALELVDMSLGTLSRGVRSESRRRLRRLKYHSMKLTMPMKAKPPKMPPTIGPTATFDPDEVTAAAADVVDSAAAAVEDGIKAKLDAVVVVLVPDSVPSLVDVASGESPLWTTGGVLGVEDVVFAATESAEDVDDATTTGVVDC